MMLHMILCMMWNKFDEFMGNDAGGESALVYV